MTTTCPNCSSLNAVGIDAVSACGECATVAIAGASFGLPHLLAVAVFTAAACVIASNVRTALKWANTRRAQPAMA